MKSFLTAIFGMIVLFAAITQAEKRLPQSGFLKFKSSEVPDCEGRPDFITEVRPQILGGFEKLPPLILIASEVDYYIESKSKGEDLRIHSYQSFRSESTLGKSKIICGSVKSFEKERFTLFAPTLIDTTASKEVGQSLWQFQLLTDEKGISAWNQRSLAFSDKESLEKNMLKFGGNYRIYQLSANEYEVVISKEWNGVAQYLSIRYDAVKSIN